MSREDHSTYERIGRNIRRLREERGLSRPQMAKACHLGSMRGRTTENHLAKVEDGYGVSVPLLLAIADALDCTLDDLVPVECGS